MSIMVWKILRRLPKPLLLVLLFFLLAAVARASTHVRTAAPSLRAGVFNRAHLGTAAPGCPPEVLYPPLF